LEEEESKREHLWRPSRSKEIFLLGLKREEPSLPSNGSDEDIGHDSPLTNAEDKHDTRYTTQPCVEQANNVYKGPMTRARAQ
jgi:hypothetical protein